MKKARKRIDELKAEQRVATKALTNAQTKLDKELSLIEEVEAVQKLFQSAVSMMYDNLSSKLGDIITEGISIVFPDSQYKFVIEFVERRNNVEADLFLEDTDGNKYDLINDVGGGITDFVCLMLRVTYILLSKYENTLFADEPLKYVDRKRIPVAATFVRKVCEDFKFQLLIISHIPELIQESESVYHVKKVKGISVVKKVD